MSAARETSREHLLDHIRVIVHPHTRRLDFLDSLHHVTPGLPKYFLHGFLHLVGDLLDRLFGLPDCLIGLPFLTQLVIAGQRAGGFLNSTLHYVCLATHDGDSYSS